ncbi:MAG TPA: hypothetical protein VLM84_14350, partial [Chromatiaceae bacterium]|nr:hypothetical protein [Chromatiaceae bacterium]
MARKVLVIGWDAADWKVIHALTEQGKMPHLAALVDVLSSQKLMLANLRRDQARLSDEQLEQAFRRQLKQVGIWLARQPNIRTLFVSHPEAIQELLAVAERVCA